jgi:hypothetical protein
MRHAVWVARGCRGQVMRVRGLAAVLVLGAAALAACSDGDGDGVDGAAAPAITVPVATVIDGASAAALAGAVGDGSCDELDVAHCLLPFPSDRFTEVDDQAETGRRIALPEGQLANATGIPLDPTEWNRNDGFSPGSPMMAVLPGVDLEASGAPPIGDLARSLADDSPTVVVDLTTGERLAHWAELDAGAGVGEPTLILRSAAALPEGHEIGVALRSLVDEAGDVIEPGGVPCLPRQPHHRDRRGGGPPRRHGGAVRRAWRGRRGPGGPAAGLELHRGQRRVHRRSVAGHARRRLRALG